MLEVTTKETVVGKSDEFEMHRKSDGEHESHVEKNSVKKQVYSGF
jgi:hypothetical protein